LHTNDQRRTPPGQTPDAAAKTRNASSRLSHQLTYGCLIWYVPPPPGAVSGLMFELLAWWNQEAAKLSPVLSSAIVHYRFESIHPFADGNGRTGRALALGVSKQGAIKLMQPLLDAGLIQRVGTRKSGRYLLA
jgi:Fic family protein